MDLSTIIVNYDTSGFLRDAIKSVLRESEGLDAECIVVDNHSPDGSAAMVRREFPQVRLIANAVNVGYSVGVNQAIAVARGRYYLVLNADTFILPGAIRELLEFMEDHPSCGIAGPKLEYPDGQLQPSCRRFYSFQTLLFRRTALGRWMPDHPAVRDHLMLDWDHGAVRDVDWLLGAALMVRRRAVEQVGLMDERYFLYLEDVDWCYRMRQGGWSVFYCPSARIVHYYRQGSREPGLFNPDFWIHLESAVRYYDKWGLLAYVSKRYLAALERPALALLDGALMFWALWGFTDPPWSAVPVAMFFVVSYLTGYRRVRSTQGFAEVTLDAFWCVFLTVAASGFFFWSTKAQVPLPHIFRSRWALLEAFPAAILSLAVVRGLLLAGRRWLAARRLVMTRCVIVGTDSEARCFAEGLSADRELGYDIAGFVGHDRSVSPLLGEPEELPELAHQVRAQEVVFVQGVGSLEALMTPVVACRRSGLDVKIVLTTPEAYLFALRSVDLADYTVIELPGTPLDGPSRFLKRALDVTVSAGVLLLLSPLLALIAWLIRLHDGGPALVAQEHIGADEVPFRLLKFRTTEPGLRPSVPLSAAGAETPPPASPLAAFLRARRLDKLPELFNVLVGDMSLVGPRPPLPEEVSMYASWHRCRFAEKPGLTGLWQVEKFRKWRFDQMVRLDLYYVLNRSLALDLQILLRTIATVFAP